MKLTFKIKVSYENLKYYITILLALFLNQFLIGETYYAYQSGNINDLSIWRVGDCNGSPAASLPGASDDIYICEGVQVIVPNINYTVNNAYVYGSIYIQGGRILTFNSNLYLYPNSYIYGNNSGSRFSVNGHLYLYDGATIHNIVNIANFDVVVNGNLYNQTLISGLKAIIGRCDLIINGVSYIDGYFYFSLSGGGTKRFNGGFIISTTGVFDNTVGEDPIINGDIINNGSWLGCTGGTCVYTLGNIAGKIINIYGTNPIPISTIRVGTASTVVNNYATVILERSDNNTLLRGNGTFNNYGTLYLGNGAELSIENLVIFNASYIGNIVYYLRNNNQAIKIPNDGSYYNLVIGVSGIKYLQTAGAILTIDNSLIIQENATLRIKSDETLNGSGSLTMTNNGILQIDKCSPPPQPELTGTYNIMDNSKIILAGNCDQSLNPLISYLPNLTLSGSGNKDISNLAEIQGNIEILGSATISGTINFIQNCSGNFIYNSNATLSLTSNLNVGNFILNNGTINVGSHTITVCGDLWRYDGGIFNSDNGLVIFNGNSISIEGTQITTFNNVLIENATTLLGHVTRMNVKGNFCNNGVFVHRNGTVNFIGTNSQITGTANTIFYDIEIANGATLIGHSTAFYLERNWTNNGGIYNHNNGTIYLISSKNATLTKAGTETFYTLNVNKPNATITLNISTLTISNELSILDGTFLVGNNTLNGPGNLTMTGGELRISKLTTVPELTGNYSLLGGTIHLNGNGNQTLRSTAPGSNTYYNITLSGSGNKNINGITNINGDLVLLGSAVFINNSAFVQAFDKRFIYNSTGTTSLSQNITVGSVYLQNGTLNPNNRTITVRGQYWKNTGGTLNTSGTVVFAGNLAQYFEFISGSNVFNILTINNSNNLYLNSHININNQLNLVEGQIVTGNNFVIANTVTTVINRINGWVNGWLRLPLPSGNSTKTFYVGTNSYYSPVTFNYNGITSCLARLRAIEGDHPDIYSTDLDPNKTVNIYWEIMYSGIPGGTSNITFNYPSDAVDELADPSLFKVSKYIMPDVWYYTPTSSSNTQTTIENFDNNNANLTFIIGEKFNPEFVYNAKIGTIYWSDPNNWIQIRSGVISCNTSSNIVTGIGTLFTQELNAGDNLTLQSDPNIIIGTVQSILDDNTLLLTANATVSVSNASFGRKKLPDINDIVNIGFMPLNTDNVEVILDIDASIHQLRFTPMARSNTLTFQDNKSLTVTTSVLVDPPSSSTNTNTVNVNNGILTLNGNMLIGKGANTGRTSQVLLNNGIINIGTHLIFNANNSSNSLLSVTGSGRINLGNTLYFDNSASYKGTLSLGSSSTFCYCGTVAQTVNFNSIVYGNLHFNNTSSNGVTIPSSITTTNVRGNVVVEGGLFYYGGTLSAAGNAGKEFKVCNNATFRMLYTATFPTGFIYNFEPQSNVEYRQTTNNLTITRTTYGNLYCIPDVNVTQRFPVTDITIKGNLVIGGPNGSVLDIAANDPNIYCEGNVIINPNAILRFSDQNRVFEVHKNWINNSTNTPTNLTQSTVIFKGTEDQEITGSVAIQSFPNIRVDKPSGTLIVSGSTTTLNVGDLTIENGEFILPSVINISNKGTTNLTIKSNGILNGANSDIYINGNWVNNNGTFLPGSSTINFIGGNIQYIQGSSTHQTLGNVIINKTNNLVAMNTSTSMLTINNFTIMNRTFRSELANSTVYVEGNFNLEGNGNFNTNNRIVNLYIRGNIVCNTTGTWTMSQNVYLDGNSQQSISGSSNIPNFINLTINNSSINDAIVLNKPINISGTLTLTKGQIVTDNTNILKVMANGSINLNAPDGNQRLSFIKGPMIHEFNNTSLITKIYPIGKDTVYHRIDLRLRQNNTTITNYTAEFFLNSAKNLNWTLPPGIDHVSDICYWEIKKGTGASVSEAYVTLYFNTEFDKIDDFSTLAIVKGNPNTWSDIGGNVTIPAPDGAITSTVPFTSFSLFSLASRSLFTNPLPIQLVEFNAKTEQNYIKTYWKTLSEFNNDYFVVEKSIDLKEFYEIGKVKSAGFSSSPLYYELFDYNPFNGYQYYRLKQVDFNGSYSYSDTIVVFYNSNYSASCNLIIYPNPIISSPLYIKLNNAKPNEKIIIELVDVIGQKLFTRCFYTDSYGNIFETISFPQNIKPGIYYITFKLDNSFFVKKIIVEN